MSDFQRIKDRLVNEDKIEHLLEVIGCSHIKREQRGHLITAQLPEKYDSNNKRSVQVKINEYLSCYIRNRADFNGDIFSLVSYLHHDKRNDSIQNDLYIAKDFICNLFGWKEFLSKERGYVIRKDYTYCLKEIIGEKRADREIVPNPVLSEDILEEYVQNPYYGWIEEGISYNTQIKYGIGFDLESKRITIPMRNRFGKLIGIKGRIMKDEDDDRKYLYLYRYNNSQELFNFHIAHPYILMLKKVYVFESEKSCMLMYENGVYNCVAVGSSSISSVQAELIKQCGLDVEIIMCFDKDKTPKEVKEVSSIITNRSVYGIVDTKGLLDEKDSPIDKGIEVFKKLEEECCFEITA